MNEQEASAVASPGVGDVLGPLGAAVMRIVWDEGEASVRTVVDRLNADPARHHAYTTVMTVMGRLHERGLLDRTRRGRGYSYRAASREEELVTSLSGQAVDQVLARYGTAALRHFAERLGEIDPDLRAELVSLAAQRPAPARGDR